MLKFVVLSDLHLVRPDKLSLGIDTAARLEQAIEAIHARHGDADFCLIAGDLVDVGGVEVYTRLQELLEGLVLPYHITLGNHDDRDAFESVFGSSVFNAETGGADHVIDKGGYRVLLLDSWIPGGRHAGALDEAQMAWLHRQLREAADRPVIVVVHHHVAPVGAPVDSIRLKNADEFVALLQAHGNVQQVISGHVHLTSCALWRGVPFLTIAGGHYTMQYTRATKRAETVRLEGPAQMAVVTADADGVLVRFDNYVEGGGQVLA